MNINTRVIMAIVRKDLIGLLPLVLLALAVFFIQPIIASLRLEDIAGDSEFWLGMQANFYWLGYFLGILLMVSVLQLDPASSLNHDWLTRPISRLDLLLAKLLFLVITVCIPVVVSRFIVNLGNDYGLALSLQYALTIEKLPAVSPIPLFFAIALLTPTLRKSISLIVLVAFVFLLPAWSVTSPLLAMLGIEIGAEFGSMMWLQALPMMAAGIVGLLLSYWLLYSRREKRRAYVAFWGSIVIVFFSVYPPGPLYDWDSAIAVHKTVINGADDTLEDAVILAQTQACYPATPIDGDGQDNPLLVQAAWSDRWLREAGSGAITFATRVKSRDVLVEWFSPSNLNRDISVDWRIDRFRTRARVVADSLDEEVPLRRSYTALNRFAPMSSISTDYWLVPGDVANTVVNDLSTRLVIDYDMALLSPASHELKTDGQRYKFPELGSCKADIDNNANTIEVECIGRGPRPELVSVELIGVSSSRVDNSSQAVLTADWVEAIGRSHVKLTLDSPSLVDSSAIMITAYNVERILHKQLVSEGLLGDSATICPLPTDALYAAIEQSSWSDKSPHEVNSVAVERNVRVEVLDWRAGAVKDAPTLLLLPGLGATAHSFDDVAPTLAEKYNVVGMTRRGVGGSSKPDHGYDTARLSQDVLQVMDTLEIDSAVLIGMSIASEELNYLGANHPERLSGLVYLDAAYDRTLPADPTYRQLNTSLPEMPPIHPSEALSYATFTEYAQRRGRPRNIAEGEILASYNLDTGAIKHDSLYLDPVMMGLQAPQYERINVPALGIYALPGSPEFLMEPWYDRNDPEVRETVAELYQLERQSKLAQIARFETEIPESQVLLLENAYHWIFLAHEQEVLAAIDTFVTELD